MAATITRSSLWKAFNFNSISWLHFFFNYFLLDKLNHNAEKISLQYSKFIGENCQNPYSMCPLNADPQASPILHNLFKVTSTITVQNDMY